MDKFDKDTQFAISSFIDQCLSLPEFTTQYLFLSLKREYLFKELLDDCLKFCSSWMIWENGDLFISVLDNIKDESDREQIKIVEG